MTAAHLLTAGATAEPLTREDDGGIVTLTLNRPGQYNALSLALLDRLQDTVDDVACDTSARVVVIAAFVEKRKPRWKNR